MIRIIIATDKSAKNYITYRDSKYDIILIRLLAQTVFELHNFRAEIIFVTTYQNTGA